MHIIQDRLILLIEDNSDDEALMLEAIDRNNIACKIKVAHDGEEALDYIFGRGEYAGRMMPHLILLDLKLPKVSGLEVIRQLRSYAPTKLIPIVVLSTSTQDSDLIAAYTLGANSYIQKPVDFMDFIAKVNQLGNYWLSLNEHPPLLV